MCNCSSQAEGSNYVALKPIGNNQSFGGSKFQYIGVTMPDDAKQMLFSNAEGDYKQTLFSNADGDPVLTDTSAQKSAADPALVTNSTTTTKKPWYEVVTDFSKSAIGLGSTANDLVKSANTKSSTTTTDNSTGLKGNTIIYIAIGLVVAVIIGYFIWKSMKKK